MLCCCSLAAMNTQPERAANNAITTARPARRLELKGPSIGHERQEQSAVPHHIATDVGQPLHYLVMQRVRLALRAGNRHRTDLEPARLGRFPAAAAAIAVDARAQH